MDNPEKLVTQSTQEEEKDNTICVGHRFRKTTTIYKEDMVNFHQASIKLN